MSYGHGWLAAVVCTVFSHAHVRCHATQSRAAVLAIVLTNIKGRLPDWFLIPGSSPYCTHASVLAR